MKAWQLIVGGLAAGSLIVVGEAILNLLLLGEEWALLLAGYVSLRIAVTTIAWGLWELPLAVGAGTWVAWRLGSSVSLMPNSRGAST